ncbi:dUTPase-like protein [Nemania sp. FL0916]|nr:dUTPase-like protein [Nemania sp. FL0916]
MLSGASIIQQGIVRGLRSIPQQQQQPGAYLVGFNETGYEGSLGALFDVRNPAGVLLYRHAKLAQIVLHRLEMQVKGYDGVYQKSLHALGRNGQGRRGRLLPTDTYLWHLSGI